MIAFHPWDQHSAGNDDVVVLNFSNTELGMYDIGLPCVGTWIVCFNSDSAHYSEQFDNFDTPAVEAVRPGRTSRVAHVGVAPYSCVIPSQDQA